MTGITKRRKRMKVNAKKTTPQKLGSAYAGSEEIESNLRKAFGIGVAVIAGSIITFAVLLAFTLVLTGILK